MCQVFVNSGVGLSTWYKPVLHIKRWSVNQYPDFCSLSAFRTCIWSFPDDCLLILSLPEKDGLNLISAPNSKSLVTLKWVWNIKLYILEKHAFFFLLLTWSCFLSHSLHHLIVCSVPEVSGFPWFAVDCVRMLSKQTGICVMLSPLH